MATFLADVSKWVEQQKTLHTAVFRESAQTVIEEMRKPVGHGGNLPFKTGFLHHSVVVSKDAMPEIRENAKPEAGKTYNESPAYNLVLSSLEIGDRLFAGFVAAYAAAQNYGTVTIPARLFVELAAQRWGSIVKATEQKLLVRIGG